MFLLCSVSPALYSDVFTDADTEAATERAVKAAEDLSAELVEAVNSGASKVRGARAAARLLCVNQQARSCLKAFEEQQHIGAEVEKVLALTKQLCEQNSQWATLINSADQSLRVLGDFETFFEVLQQDLSNLTGSLQQLSQQQLEVSAEQSTLQ